jgi:hypothetical protein
MSIEAGFGILHDGSVYTHTHTHTHTHESIYLKSWFVHVKSEDLNMTMNISKARQV